ncbi:ComF family protein [Okeania sp.]|uniref:ComF family protein n=1 Tax=Okeania sp. TaxID=3100323 RepID=UPI002B4AEAE5|nr:ComF family protein [Okeania sp.]MEB3342259.1 ComF family protein [Okeania sp.]
MIKFIWRTILKPFLNIFLKPNCPLCQRSANREFCQYCEEQVWRCQFSGGGEIFSGEVPIFIWGQYKDSLKRAIAAMKYEDNPQIARPLGYWLADGWLASPVATLDRVVVVPIPMHKKKQRKRGFNQAELLANSFCAATGLQIRRNALARVKQTQALYGLSPGERVETVKDAFVVGKYFRNCRPRVSVLLVDDIYTTGATVNSAIEVLQQGGIKVVGVLAIATTKKAINKKIILKSQKVVKKLGFTSRN